MNNEHDQIRNDQQQEGLTRTLSLPAARTARSGSSTAPRKPFVAKGHDAILKGMQDIGGRVLIVTMGDGTEHEGKLAARDKFTITILTDSGCRITFYKHAIESFQPIGSVE